MGLPVSGTHLGNYYIDIEVYVRKGSEGVTVEVFFIAQTSYFPIVQLPVIEQIDLDR